jgi:hypothetical protein
MGVPRQRSIFRMENEEDFFYLSPIQNAAMESKPASKAAKSRITIVENIISEINCKFVNLFQNTEM